MLLLGAIHLLNPPQHYFKPLSGERNFEHLETLEYKRKKRAEKKAKESREAKYKSYEDYLWTELCEDVSKLLKKATYSRTKQVLEHHRLKLHLPEQRE